MIEVGRAVAEVAVAASSSGDILVDLAAFNNKWISQRRSGSVTGPRYAAAVL